MKKNKLTLSKCTRDDLIWIIKRLLQKAFFRQEDYQIQCVLNDLWYEKEKKRFDEAEKISALADAKRREYLEILKPYDGMPIRDIPVDVLRKTEVLRSEANLLDKKWMRMMDIGE